MAGLTGLEPATSGVTDRHSNQLSYSPPDQTLNIAGHRGAVGVAGAGGHLACRMNVAARWR